MPFLSRAPKETSNPDFAEWGETQRVGNPAVATICVPISFEPSGASDAQRGRFAWNGPESSEIVMVFESYAPGGYSRDMTAETFEQSFIGAADPRIRYYPELPAERLRIGGHVTLRFFCRSVMAMHDTALRPDLFAMPEHIEIDADGKSSFACTG